MSAPIPSARRFLGLVAVQTIAGPPVVAGPQTITPLARVVLVRLPRGGFVWNRPLAVLVRENGRVTRIPIRDVTYYGQLALLGATVALWIAARRVAARGKEHGAS
ncbi:MAG TPA: hypothetical protein VKY74_18410 [Chloroflexia bacterium]|nr:hypothetical protein [Chloroflexia bacterium]